MFKMKTTADLSRKVEALALEAQGTIDQRDSRIDQNNQLIEAIQQDNKEHWAELNTARIIRDGLTKRVV